MGSWSEVLGRYPEWGKLKEVSVRRAVHVPLPSFCSPQSLWIEPQCLTSQVVIAWLLYYGRLVSQSSRWCGTFASSKTIFAGKRLSFTFHVRGKMKSRRISLWRGRLASAAQTTATLPWDVCVGFCGLGGKVLCFHLITLLSLVLSDCMFTARISCIMVWFVQV